MLKALKITLLAITTCSFLACATTAMNTPRSPELKLVFTIEKEFDTDNVVGMFRHNDPSGIESRARSMGVDAEQALKIRNAKTRTEAWQIADQLVAGRHADKPGLEKARQEYITLWKELITPFSEVVTETTQHDWFYPEYTVVVSAVHPGLSDWHGNKVACGSKQDEYRKRRILAHEIVLSHMFHLMREQFPVSELDDWRVWAFSEISTVFVLDNPRLNRFWPQFRKAGTYFAHSNYSQLRDLEQQLKLLFDARKSFSEFIKSAAPVLKKFSNTHRK